MTVVRGHNEGSIFHRKTDSHRVATVTMPTGKRPTLACPHRHRPSDRDCPESKALLVELLRLRDHHGEDVEPERIVVHRPVGAARGV